MFHQVLFLDINFQKFLPSSLRLDFKQKVVINPKNEEDEECFKWAVLTALHQDYTWNEYQNNNKINDPILNLTPKNITQHSGIE